MQINFLKNNIKNTPIKNLQPDFFINHAIKKDNLDIFKYYNAIKNYNIPFLAKAPEQQEPIYVIDIQGNYKKYDSIDDASAELKTTTNKILKCLNGETEYTDGFVFVYATDMEQNDELNDFMLDLSSDILKELQDPTKPFLTLNEVLLTRQDTQKNGRITRVCDIGDEILDSAKKKRYLKNPFYIMDETLAYRKFYSREHVVNALGVGVNRVHNCLNGKSYIDGFALAYADEIETVGQGGKISVDLEKLKSHFKKKEGFYAIDKEGNYQKFENARQASDALNLSYTSIVRCCSGKQTAMNDYIFVRAKEVEVENTDGKIVVDVSKINAKRLLLEKDAIYLVSEKGYKRYKDHFDASEQTGIDKDQILSVLAGYYKTVCGCTVLRASEVERRAKNGEIILNKKKLKDAYVASHKKAKAPISERGFYAINEKGEYQKFYKIAQAESACSAQSNNIIRCLNGTNYVLKGYIFVRAEDIEYEEGSETKVDKMKIAQKLRLFRRNEFYAIDKQGNYKHFYSREEAASEFGVSKSSITLCLSGKTGSCKDHILVWAEKIEDINENGEVTLNQPLIKELSKELTKTEFYAVDKEGNYQKFNNKALAGRTLKIDSSTISACLNGRAQSLGGYIFMRASEVEIVLDDGSIVVDEQKIKEKLKTIKGAK